MLLSTNFVPIANLLLTLRDIEEEKRGGEESEGEGLMEKKEEEE